MKKIILATDNKKIIKEIKKIKNLNNNKINIKKVEYREAILEVLNKEKNIDFIFLHEKINGEISIEELLKKIKIINKKINIIFFLEKENKEKENILKKLEIKNIYYLNKINKNKIKYFLENKNEDNLKNTEKINNNKNIIKIRKNKINKIYRKINKKFNKNKHINNNIIIFYEKNSLKENSIINLFINYLINKNKKILLINLINENNFYNLLYKKYLKNKNIKNKINIINNFEKNLKNKNKKQTIINIKNFVNNKKHYDFILFNIDFDKKYKNKYLIRNLINIVNKKIYIIENNFFDFKDFIKNFKKYKKEFRNNKNNLFIIIKKNILNSISKSIIKNIIGRNTVIHQVFYLKKYKKINKLKKNKYKKIFNKILK